MQVFCDKNVWVTFKRVSFVCFIMIVYLSFHRNFTVIGILKMGWMKMHLCDKTGLQSEAMDCSCLLDFYIHETRQRKGYGKRLMDYMLQVRVHFFKIPH